MWARTLSKDPEWVGGFGEIVAILSSLLFPYRVGALGLDEIVIILGAI